MSSVQKSLKEMSRDELYVEIDRRRNAFQRSMSELAHRTYGAGRWGLQFDTIAENVQKELSAIRDFERNGR